MNEDTKQLALKYSSATTIKDVTDFIQENQRRLRINLYEGVSEETLSIFESSKIHLPDDVKDFYRFCNGFESSEDMFRIIPFDEILDNKPDTYLITSTSFHFAEYMIYGDIWTLDINPKNNNDYIIYNKAEEIVVLTNSFIEFMVVFLNGGVFDGLYKWRKEKSNK